MEIIFIEDKCVHEVRSIPNYKAKKQVVEVNKYRNTEFLVISENVCDSYSNEKDLH